MTSDDLKAWRTRRGLKEVDAAKILTVAAQTFRQWEDGRRGVPNWVPAFIANLELLARYLEKFGVLGDE